MVVINIIAIFNIITRCTFYGSKLVQIKKILFSCNLLPFAFSVLREPLTLNANTTIASFAAVNHMHEL